MENVINDAIVYLAAKSSENYEDANKALKFSQAALNLAHVAKTLSEVDDD